MARLRLLIVGCGVGRKTIENITTAVGFCISKDKNLYVSWVPFDCVLVLCVVPSCVLGVGVL